MTQTVAATSASAACTSWHVKLRHTLERLHSRPFSGRLPLALAAAIVSGTSFYILERLAVLPIIFSEKKK